MSSVSVVMTVYNGQVFLREQVGSVLSQLLPGDELIIVDDASKDASLQILADFSSPILHVYTNVKNMGVIGSFDRGMRLSQGEIIFFCDQDDIWLPGKRDAFVAAFECDPAVNLVISDAEVIDAAGKVTSLSFMATRGGFRGSALSTVWSNRYIGCAMAVRSTLLEIVLPMPSGIPMHDMWIGALASIFGKVSYLSTPFLQYRRHGNNVSPEGRQSLKKMLKWRICLLLALAVRLLRYQSRVRKTS